MVKIVSWNINKSRVAVRELLEMDADVALLQEAGVGALDDLRSSGPAVAVSPQEPWEPWPRDAFDRWPVVVELSDRVEVEWFEQVLPSTPWLGQRRMAAGNVGTIAVAKIIPTGGGRTRPHRVCPKKPPTFPLITPIANPRPPPRTHWIMCSRLGGFMTR